MKTPTLPHEQAWRAALTALYGHSEAERLIARIHARHRRLSAERPQNLSRAEAKRLLEKILPSLALYQSLRETGVEQKEALSVTADLLWLTLERQRRVLRFLRRLPSFLALALLRQLLRRGYVDEVTTFVQEEEGLLLEVAHCFILEMLLAYETPELTRVFCEMDDRLGALLPDGIQWRRTGILAEDAEAGDFRYRRSL